MATKFVKMPPIGDVENKEHKKTVFKRIIYYHLLNGTFIEDTNDSTEQWQNVMHLWKDKYYGDVFRCWDNDQSNSVIYFGEAGDEFNQ